MIQQPRSEVRLLASAEQDLREIINYIAQDNPVSAEALLHGFEVHFQTLSVYPLLGRIPFDSDLQKLDYRYLVAGKYLIFYKIDGTNVLVYRILHSAQDYMRVLDEDSGR